MAPSFLDLNEDVLHQIWLNFSVVELTNLRIVCKSFKKISEQTLKTLKNLSCCGSEDFNKKIDFFIRFCPSIRSFSATKIQSDFENILQSLSQHFVHLERITIAKSEAVDDSNIYLIAYHLPKIVTIELSHLKITDIGLEQLIDGCNFLRSLSLSYIIFEGICLGSLRKHTKELTLIDCDGFTMDGFQCFLDGEGKFIEKLHMTKSRKDQLDSEILNKILDELCGLNSLIFKSYDLRTINLTTEKLRNLTSFEFRGFCRIQTNICALPLTLKSLRLAIYDVDDGSLGTMLDKMPNLRYLELSIWKEVTWFDETVNAITEMPHLTTLRINVKSLGANVSVWFSVFDSCRSLKYAYICRVGEEEKHALQEHIHCNQNVERNLCVYVSVTPKGRLEKL